MVFSSHRFGNLTRHADLILCVFSVFLGPQVSRMLGVRSSRHIAVFGRYMDETGIVESGTHDELLRGKGEYARLWTLQAQAFLS